jgi:hypothetical protein
MTKFVWSMSGSRRFLKLLAISVIFGGHCLACATSPLMAVAAEPSSSVAADHCHDSSQSLPSQSSGCPMQDDLDGVCLDVVGAVEPQAAVPHDLSATSDVPAGAFSAAFTPYHELLRQAQAAPPDRTPPLTGIIVKNE